MRTSIHSFCVITLGAAIAAPAIAANEVPGAATITTLGRLSLLVDESDALIAGAQCTSIRVGAAEGATLALCTALAAGTSGDTGLVAGTPDPAQADGPALDQLAARAAGEAAIGTRFVLVSDFSDPDRDLARAVRTLRARGDVVLVWVFDALEVHLPPPARYPLTDGRAHLLLDTAPAGVRAAHARDVAVRRERLARFAVQSGTRCHAVRTGEDVFSALERPFAEAAARPPGWR